MALQIISVLLFTVFFSEALTLMCYNCITPVPPGTCTQNVNCTSQSAKCSSVTTYNPNVTSVTSCNTLCDNWSVNVGQIRMTSQCCESDYCNNVTQDLTSNTMMCYSCNGKTYSDILPCKGDERQCITVTAELFGNGTTTTLKGCASKNICDNTGLLKLKMPDVKNVSCCDQKLCNSAQSLTQGAVLLLVPMLPVLFSI
ncbi:ly6/PLAUR domain-containing protein 8 [Labeo rohita]|uniref:ly6/PLAUR domain-containing protein 8 n=1 Tax=Labeo rohita TaxID=84645 RepID=UPI0021E29BBA|nr:ly6/PLAUR domain-containing protein 8 [Labeo rohita]